MYIDVTFPLPGLLLDTSYRLVLKCQVTNRLKFILIKYYEQISNQIPQ